MTLTTHVIEAFKFGICTTPTIGATVVDMGQITGPMADVAVEDQRIGGSTRSIDGTLHTTTYGMKRKITITPLSYAPQTEFWPILRFWKSYFGPWIFFDQTVSNKLTSNQKLLLTWTNATGTPVSPRLDGALNLAAAGVAQMGPTTSPNAIQLVPVVVGQQYTFGIGLCGALGAVAAATWQAGIVVAWYTSAFASISTSSATFLGSAPQGLFGYLDGSLNAGRYWLTATAPATAAYAQIRITNSGATSVDVLDPCMIEGPNDPGNAWMLVSIDTLPEIHPHPQTASLTLNLLEV